MSSEEVFGGGAAWGLTMDGELTAIDGLGFGKSGALVCVNVEDNFFAKGHEKLELETSAV